LSDVAEPYREFRSINTRIPYTGYALYLTASILFALNGTVAKSILLTGIDPARLPNFG